MEHRNHLFVFLHFVSKFLDVNEAIRPAAKQTHCTGLYISAWENVLIGSLWKHMVSCVRHRKWLGGLEMSEVLILATAVE
jgi:hypothetical protein